MQPDASMIRPAPPASRPAKGRSVGRMVAEEAAASAVAMRNAVRPSSASTCARRTVRASRVGLTTAGVHAANVPRTSSVKTIGATRRLRVPACRPKIAFCTSPKHSGRAVGNPSACRVRAPALPQLRGAVRMSEPGPR